MGESVNNQEKQPRFEYATTQLVYPRSIYTKLLQFIDKAIDPEDVYTESDGSKGKENKPHITVLYGIKEQKPNDEAKKVLKEIADDLNNLTVDFKGLGKFESPEFDVLKINVDCDALKKAFDAMNKLYPDNANSFSNYSPHSTIAYLKKGKADKYIQKYSSKFIISKVPLEAFEFEFNENIYDFKLRSDMKTSSRQISITPDQYALMERIQKQGLNLKQVIDLKLSRTYKSLLEKKFIDLQNYREVVLTKDGSEVMRLIPRWSGKARDKYGNPVQVWNVVKNSDGSYSNFSHDVTDKDHRKDMVVDMPDEAEKSTMPESRSLKEIQERKEGPTASKKASLIDLASEARLMSLDAFLDKEVSEAGHKIDPPNNYKAHDTMDISDMDPSEVDEWSDYTMLDPDGPRHNSYKDIQNKKKFLEKGGRFNPILVEGWKNSGFRPMVLDGHHRVAGAILAGVTKLPVIYDIRTLIEIWLKVRKLKLTRSDINSLIERYDEGEKFSFDDIAKKSSVNKVSYVAHVPGHKNSQGESAPWVIKSHETGKILSSHKTKAEAKEHLKQMEYFKHKGSFKAKFLNK